MDPRLPINQRRDEIAALIREHQVVVLCGATGSGKTTQLPQICLELARAAGGRRIAHTQPRRLAARSVAARIAHETGTPLGGLVGVKVRFQDTTGPATRVKLVTDGMLLAELDGDRSLGEYDTVIIDEAHERSLNIDFLLGVLRSILPRRPDLKVIVTSATIDPARFAGYFAGPRGPAPVIEVSGRTYPVEVRYRPGSDDDETISMGALIDAAAELCSPRLPEGDILAFLPGEREIRMAAEALKRSRLDAEVLPLFARLSTQEQDRIFSPTGGRRIILATNIAETSLTVPGIRYVIDTGLARINRWDAERRVQRLPVEPISRASADQRAGRCGRVSEGVCVRLYSEASYKSRPAFTDPEIRRSGLASVILQMRSLGLPDIEDFPFLDRPEAGAVRDGYVSLFELGAIGAPDRTGRLTPIGRAMARIPADPRVARIMLAAEPEGSLDEAMVLAAAMSIQDPRERPAGKQAEADAAHEVFRHETSDFVTLLNLWDQYRHAQGSLGHRDLYDWCRRHFVSAARMREWGETLHQIRQVAEDLELRRGRGPAGEDAVHRALLTGLIANVACREGDASSYEYRAMHASGVSIFPGSSLFKKSPRWIMAAEIVHTTRLYARTVARIDPVWIEELAAHVYQRHLSDPHLDPASGEPCAWERITLAGVAVVPRRRATLAEIDPGRAREVFIRDALARGLWSPTAADAPAFLGENLRTLALADSAAARLRRHNLRADDAALAAFFEKRLPATVHNPATLAAWWSGASEAERAGVRLSATDVLGPGAAAALDAGRFPERIGVHGEGAPGDAREPVGVSLAFTPGQDQDGLTLDVPLTSLHHVDADRAAWLIPGWTGELFAALLKTTPKAARARIEDLGAVNDTAAACAEVSAFGVGTVENALAEALGVLFELRIEAGAVDRAALPPHLRPRYRVLDHHGKELAVSRDLDDLRVRLEGRAKKARAAKARLLFQREGMTRWDFDEVPAEAPEDEQAGSVALFPALIDRAESVELTLVESPARAAALTHAGVRRLLVLACRKEVDAYLDSLPDWSQMVAHHKALGPTEALRDGLACLAVERAFMAGFEPIRTRGAFEAALQDRRGRLPTAAREVGETVAKTLEPRAKVAHRLSGGTPRLWAASIADIREHAAYLMPGGFLLSLPWERLRRYPVYATAMRERLFRLREDGSGAETELLNRFAPHWKRFTAWVAQRLSAERAAAEQVEAARRESPNSKAPLPQARRAAPRVNLEAGEWAMLPGSMPPEVDAYRWALEEARVCLFAPELAGGGRVSLDQLAALWQKVEPAPTGRRG